MARILENFLLEAPPPTVWDGLRIFELGSGTGWLALRLASLGACITATDRASRLPSLQLNVISNQVKFADFNGGTLAIEIGELDWEEVEGADAPSPEQGWDLVVGSDLLYLHEMHQPLVNQLVRLLQSHPVSLGALFAWEERFPTQEASFLCLCAAAGLTSRPGRPFSGCREVRALELKPLNLCMIWTMDS